MMSLPRASRELVIWTTIAVLHAAILGALWDPAASAFNNRIDADGDAHLKLVLLPAAEAVRPMVPRPILSPKLSSRVAPLAPQVSLAPAPEVPLPVPDMGPTTETIASIRDSLASSSTDNTLVSATPVDATALQQTCARAAGTRTPRYPASPSVAVYRVYIENDGRVAMAQIQQRSGDDVEDQRIAECVTMHGRFHPVRLGGVDAPSWQSWTWSGAMAAGI